MNREPDSWKIKGFQSNNEARATGMSFAFHGWTARENAIQASDFRVSSVDRVRGSLADRDRRGEENQ